VTIATNGDIGRYIRRKREEHGWTQFMLSQRAGIGLRTVVRIEAGSPAGTAKVDTLRDIAEALGVKLSELLEAGR
jgi:transcriptional regulator with XRE-family HTH domain